MSLFCWFPLVLAEAHVGMKAELYLVMRINLSLCCVCAACPSLCSNNLFNFCTKASLTLTFLILSFSLQMAAAVASSSRPNKYIFLLLMYLTHCSPSFFLASSSPLFGSFCAGRGCCFLSPSLSLLIPSIDLPDSHQNPPQLPAWTLMTKKEEITSGTGFIRDFSCL